MLQKNQTRQNNLILKDFSLVHRYTIFICAYMKHYNKNINLLDAADTIVDEYTEEHLEHIASMWPSIMLYFEEFAMIESYLDETLNDYLKNNNVENLGVVGLILKLIMFEAYIDKANLSLYITDYFTVCNIFNIPDTYIKMINKVIKNIKIGQIQDRV